MYKVFRTKQLFSPSFFRWRMKKHVPDVDDYDDDNSLASLFCLCCAALSRALPSPRHAGGISWDVWETSQKLRKDAQFELCFGEDLLSNASFQKQRLSLLCGLGRAPTSLRPTRGTRWLISVKDYTHALFRRNFSYLEFQKKDSHPIDAQNGWYEYRAGVFFDKITIWSFRKQRVGGNVQLILED